MLIRWLLVSLNTFLAWKTIDGQNCEEQASCALSSLSNPSLMYCYGERSCAQATLIEITNGGDIRCWGAFSCYEAQLINNVGDSVSNDIECYALYSCAFVDRIYTENGQIECFGENSCYGSRLVMDDDNLAKNVICYGLRSCALSNITISNNVAIYGAYGAQNALIRSVYAPSKADFNILVYSFDALNGATIACARDTTCSVTCRAAGCISNNITFMCSNETDISCVNKVVCYMAIRNDLCPDGYKLPLGLEFPILKEKQFSTYENSHGACFTQSTGGINCADYQGCEESQILNTTESDSGAICCTAYWGCLRAHNIIATINFNETSSNYVDTYNTSIRIDGYYGADDAHGTMSAPNGGHMYFTGSYATSEYFVGDGAVSIENNGEYDVISSASYGLDETSVLNINNLYCMAIWACHDSSFTNINGNVYSYSQSSLTSSSVDNVKGDMYCPMKQSCHTVTATNIGGNVIGLGEYVFENSQYTNVSGVLVAFGKYALRSARIKGISYMFVNGNNALYDTTIISETTSVAINESGLTANGGINTFIIYINGTNNVNSFDVYCNETDTCKIKCQSSLACDLMHLYCIGTCIIDCDEDNGYQCPLVSGVDFIYDTLTLPPAPTAIPTVIPTDIPTDIPSKIPSNVPSYLPTTLPTDNATDMPAIDISSTDETTSIHTSDSSDTSDASTMASTIQNSVVLTNNTSTGDTGTTGAESIEESDEDDDSGDFPVSERIILIALIIIGIVLLVVCLAIIFCCFQRQKSKHEIILLNKKIELKKLEMSSNGTTTNGTVTAGGTSAHISNASAEGIKTELHTNNGNSKQLQAPATPAAPDRTTSIQIDDYVGSGRVNPAGQGASAGNGAAVGRTGTLVQSGQSDDYENESLFGSVKMLPTQPKTAVNVTNTGVDLTASPTSTLVIGRTNTDIDKLMLSDEDGNDSMNEYATGSKKTKTKTSSSSKQKNVLDERNLVNWTQSDVLKWVKNVLLANGFDRKLVKYFLLEWNKKAVNGKVLLQLQNNNGTMIDSFKSEFSSKNQTFGIWMVLKSSIVAINSGETK